jgi:hypothetical protein
MTVTRKNKKESINLKIMTKTFRLIKRGQISFENDKIYISDKAKSDKYFRLSRNLFLLVFGIINIRKFYREGGHFYYFFWIILVVVILLIFAVTLLRSTKSVILFEEVKSIQFKQRLNTEFLDIRLKDNRLRRVSQIEDIEELEEYIETYYNSMTKK